MSTNALPDLKVGYEYRIRCYVSRADQRGEAGTSHADAQLRPHSFTLNFSCDEHDFSVQLPLEKPWTLPLNVASGAAPPSRTSQQDFDVWVECTEEAYAHMAERAFASVQAQRPRLTQLGMAKQTSSWHRIFTVGDSELQTQGSLEFVHLEVHLLTKEVGLFRKVAKRGLQFSGRLVAQQNFRLSKKFISLKLPKLAAMSAISSLSSFMTATQRTIILKSAEAPVAPLPAANELPLKLTVS